MVPADEIELSDETLNICPAEAESYNDVTHKLEVNIAGGRHNQVDWWLPVSDWSGSRYRRERRSKLSDADDGSRQRIEDVDSSVLPLLVSCSLGGKRAASTKITQER